MACRAFAGGFTFQDTKGEHLDVLRDGKVVARYMYASDNSTPERRLETYKTYLHVFDPAGTVTVRPSIVSETGVSERLAGVPKSVCG